MNSIICGIISFGFYSEGLYSSGYLSARVRHALFPAFVGETHATIFLVTIIWMDLTNELLNKKNVSRSKYVIILYLIVIGSILVNICLFTGIVNLYSSQTIIVVIYMLLDILNGFFYIYQVSVILIIFFSSFSFLHW